MRGPSPFNFHGTPQKSLALRARAVHYTNLGWSSSPSASRSPPANAGPRPQRNVPEQRFGTAPRHGASLHSSCGQEESMKTLLSLLLAFALLFTAAPASFA